MTENHSATFRPIGITAIEVPCNLRLVPYLKFALLNSAASYGTQSDSVNLLPFSANYLIIGIPIALRVIYTDQFVRGPFHLGNSPTQ